MILNKEELEKWLKSAWNHGSMAENTDKSGNIYVTEIYKKDDKYYAVEFHNDKLLERYNLETGYVKNEYEINEVKPIKVVIDDWEYV